MKLPLALTSLLLALTPITFAKRAPERTLLSSIKTLTLRQGLKTTHNRVAPVPQLKCVGGTAKGLYDIDVLRCKNAGSSYDDADIEWTCTASLPAEFKLGSTDVICEGFTGPNDPYVLKGSCGVEYRLMLTKLGEEKHGRKGGSDLWSNFPEGKGYSDIAAGLFWVAFVAVLLWMLYAAFFRDRGALGLRGVGNGFGGGWGGGGGGGDNNDPPPPYDPRPPRKPPTYGFPRTSYSRSAGQTQQQGWRPGFWTGALGGAAAGYMAGGRGNRSQQDWGHGEGSSGLGAGRTRSSGSSSSSSGYGSARHESTGFGGTSRR